MTAIASTTAHPVRTIEVRQLSGPAFNVDFGVHSLTLDQPPEAGGADSGPTPTEAFVASLAACTLHYAYSYLSRHGLPSEGLSLRCDWEWATPPSRVARIELALTLPEGVPEERREAVLRSASRCAVHNSMVQPPEVDVHL